ncbi:MAG: undecaprenyl-diphosphate phosphatase [bacterium]
MDGISLSGQAFFLGALQGLTEFLPISSSAHLILIPWFFNWHNPFIDSLTFGVAVHAGTLLAIFIYFYQDWLKMSSGLWEIMRHGRLQNFQNKLILYIILASIPAALTGILLEDIVEVIFRDPLLIIFPLILVSFLMMYAERKAGQEICLEDMRLTQAIIIGLAQSLALLPGVSRSGITIITALLLGFRRESSARFSFLLSAPIIAGAAIFHLRHLLSGERNIVLSILMLGAASSFCVGFLAIAFLMRFLKEHSLHLFAYYRLILAALTLWGIIWS